MTRKLLVIGKTGQLATALLRAPPPEGFEPVAIGRDELDLADPRGVDAVLDAIRPALVINAAAYTAVDRAESEPRLAYAVNASGPATIARAASARDIGFIQISTDYVFDGAKQGLWVEDDPVGPLGVYGASKLAGELQVRAAHPDAVIIRTSWVVSAGGNNFVRTMLRLAVSRPELTIVDDQFGRPTVADSLARAIHAAIPRIAARVGIGSVYHFSNEGPVTTWHGFAKAIFAAAGAGPHVRAISTADYPTPARRPSNSALDIGKFVATFGHAPVDWRDALGDVMRMLEAAGEVPAVAR